MTIADCSAIYSGRGDSYLPPGIRAILVKDDGSVSIHNDVGNKPLNYMKTASFVESKNSLEEKVWTFDARNESLSITIHSEIMSTGIPLAGGESGLIKDGTEHNLQKWLSENPQVLGEGYTVVKKEYPTDDGPVDLLVLDREGLPIAVEIKRVAMVPACDQIRRYVDALKNSESNPELDYDLSKTRGMIAALDIRPKTLLLAEKRGLEVVTIPENWKDTSEETFHFIHSKPTI